MSRICWEAPVVLEEDSSKTSSQRLKNYLDSKAKKGNHPAHQKPATKVMFDDVDSETTRMMTSSSVFGR